MYPSSFKLIYTTEPSLIKKFKMIQICEYKEVLEEIWRDLLDIQGRYIYPKKLQFG